MLENNQQANGSAGVFGPTDWSLVLEAAEDAVGGDALNRLCGKYWRPIYITIRGRGVPQSEAEDVAQDFFVDLLEKKWIKRADPERGKFRLYLRTLLMHFLLNHRRTQGAQKRSGTMPNLSFNAESCELELKVLSAALDPAQLFDRVWANCVISEALRRLEQECATTGSSATFKSFSPFMLQPPEAGEYERLEKELGLLHGQVAKRVYALRRRFFALIRVELAATLANQSDVDSELRHLLSAVSS